MGYAEFVGAAQRGSRLRFDSRLIAARLRWLVAFLDADPAPRLAVFLRFLRSDGYRPESHSCHVRNRVFKVTTPTIELRRDRLRQLAQIFRAILLPRVSD
jgi:hypothetical protein